jgi:hypothetical protein
MRSIRAAVLVSLFSCGLINAQPATVGATIPEEIRLGYERNARAEASIRFAGASFIKVHVAALDLRQDDVMTVSDRTGRETHTYSAADRRTGFWSLSIEGDVAIVRLLRRGRDDGRSHRGVVIDRLTRGFAIAKPDVGPAKTASICGANDERFVSCYTSSHPTEYIRSHAVAKLLLNGGTSACTAWRVGPDSADYMFTNQHCVASQTNVDDLEVQFNYQTANCTSLPVTPVKVEGRTLLQANAALDYALFTVKSHWLLGSFGFLEIDPRLPLAGEEIYIPQHPGGGRKMFGINSDTDTGNLCRIFQPVTGVDTNYRCDTEPGSSGSPVLARSSHRVIAIHHTGGPCPNEGVRFNLIAPQVRQWFQWKFVSGNGGSNQIALWNMNPSDKYVTGDFDNDNQDELLAISTGGWSHLMQMNAGAWQWLWGNGGNGKIALWNMGASDRYASGDFDGDGRDELLAIANNGWSHLMRWNGLSWQWFWGNSGNGKIALWNMAPTDRYVVGDFDGDGRDELFAIANNGWSHLMRWNGSSWQWFWGNSGNGKIALWNMAPTDRYVAGDFDNDGRDELHVVANNGWSHLMRWNGSSWQWSWGNNGSGKIALWNMATTDKYSVGDFEGDGRDELLVISNGGWVHTIKWNGTGFQWFWGNGGMGHLALWYINPADRYFAGDFDQDSRTEILSVSGAGGWAQVTEYVP